MLESLLRRVVYPGMASLTFCFSSCSAPESIDTTNIGENPYGAFMVDTSFDFSGMDITDKIIPDSVKKESANPSIVNPYSGNRFGKDAIGTFSPQEHFFVPTWDLGVKYVLPYVPFFIGGNLEVPLEETRTDNGKLGEDYTYARLLDRGGVDFVRYFYGIKYEPSLLNPTFGFHFQFGEKKRARGSNFIRRFFFEPQATYSRADVTYNKGIEAFKDQHIRTTIDKSTLEIFELDFKLGLIWKGEEGGGGGGWSGLLTTPGFKFYLHGGPLFVIGSGVEGYTAGLGLGFSF